MTFAGSGAGVRCRLVTRDAESPSTCPAGGTSLSPHSPRNPSLWVAPGKNAAMLLRRGITLLRTEGFGGLIRGACRYLATVRRLLYRSDDVRVYHLNVAAAARVPVAAPCQGVHLHIIETRDDALALAREGYENVLDLVPGAGRRLSAGLVAACAFIDSELASLDWIALTPRGEEIVDPAPYLVDFGRGEACTGGAFTVRRFRRRGIAAYRFSIQVQYLLRRGCPVCHNSIAVANVASQRCVERYGATFDAVLRRRRLLGKLTYRETPMPASAHPDAELK
jgi:hypothetical protein